MAVATRGKLKIEGAFFATPSTGAFAGIDVPVNVAAAVGLNPGTGSSDLINLISVTPYTFVASTPQTVDLTSLLDPFGNAVNLANVRLMVILNLATTTGYTLLAGDSGSNEWDAVVSASGTMTVPPSSPTNPTGGFIIVSAPWGLAVSGTHKTFKLDPSGNAFSAVLYLFGSTT
jgi:hypothetical protein